MYKQLIKVIMRMNSNIVYQLNYEDEGIIQITEI